MMLCFHLGDFFKSLCCVVLCCAARKFCMCGLIWWVFVADLEIFGIGLFVVEYLMDESSG